MTDQPDQGLLDTSVVVELDAVEAESLPRSAAVSAITLAELAAGAVGTRNPAERARRQDLLLRTDGLFDPLPFDDAAARSYSLIYAAAKAAGRRGRRQRTSDLQIAAIALAHRLPLYTRHPRDYEALEGIVEVVAI